MLKEFFDRYQLKMYGCSLIKTHYFYTSRLASFAPSLQPLRLEKFERLFRQYNQLSLRMFLSNLQFPKDVIQQLSVNLGWDEDRQIEDFQSSVIFQQLQKDPLFRVHYDRIRIEQRTLAVEYLRSMFEDGELPPRIAFVDVGWKGTIQDNIAALLGPDYTLEGFYVGLVASGARSGTNKKSGLLFAAEPTPTPYFGAFAETCPLFEIFLSAQHPGVLRYQRIDGSVKPVFGQEEKDPALRDQLLNVQQAILNRFDEILEVFASGHVDEANQFDLVSRLHSRMGLQPTDQELQLVASVEHFENFGIFENTTFSIGDGRGLLGGLRSLLRYMRDPASVLNSSLWPALSLHREGLRQLAPWYARRRMREIFRAF
jgi:hypothetical protein